MLPSIFKTSANWKSFSNEQRYSAQYFQGGTWRKCMPNLIEIYMASFLLSSISLRLTRQLAWSLYQRKVTHSPHLLKITFALLSHGTYLGLLISMQSVVLNRRSSWVFSPPAILKYMLLLLLKSVATQSTWRTFCLQKRKASKDYQALPSFFVQALETSWVYRLTSHVVELSILQLCLNCTRTAKLQLCPVVAKKSVHTLIAKSATLSTIVSV